MMCVTFYFINEKSVSISFLPENWEKILKGLKYSDWKSSTVISETCILNLAHVTHCVIAPVIS